MSIWKHLLNRLAKIEPSCSKRDHVVLENVPQLSGFEDHAVPENVPRSGKRPTEFRIIPSIQDSRFKIQDSRFKIQDSRFEIQDSRGI